MKKNLLITFLLYLLINIATAQTSVYHPFPDSIASWREMSWYTDFISNPNNPPDIETQNIISLGGDTVISSNHYTILLQTGHHYCINCAAQPITWDYYTDSVVGAIRQDTALRRVYWVSPNNTSEQLLYDFNISLGDTLYGHPVTVIDSILIGNNYRKRYRVATLTCHLIEGIGSTDGLLNGMFQWFEEGAGLYCFHQDNISYYNGDTISNGTPFADSTFDCNLTSGIKEIQNMSSINIYPNPATTLLNIHQSLPSPNQQLIITDLLGTEVYKEMLPSIDNCQLSIDNLKAGIYFYEVRSNTDIARGKFVKVL